MIKKFWENEKAKYQVKASGPTGLFVRIQDIFSILGKGESVRIVENGITIEPDEVCIGKTLNCQLNWTVRVQAEAA